VVPWLITTPAWAVLAAHLAGAAVREAGDRAVMALAAAMVATSALTFLLVTRARPASGGRST
jgi:hypothetical protein